MAKIEKQISINVEVAAAKKAVDDLTAALDKLKEEFAQLTKESEQYNEVAEKITETNKRLRAATIALNKAIKDQAAAMADVNAAADDEAKTAEKNAKRQENYKKIIEDLEKQIKKLKERLDATSSSSKDYESILDDLKKKQEALKNAQNKYNESLKDNEGQVKSSTDKNKTLKERLDELNETQKKLNKEIKETPETADALDKNISALKKANKETKEATDANEENLKTIADLKVELAALKKQIENTASGTKEQADLIEQLKDKQKELSDASVDYDRALGKQRKSLGGINEDYSFTADTLGELLQVQKQLRKSILEVPVDSEEFIKLSEAYRKVNEQVTAYNRELRGSKSLQQNIEDAIKATSKEAGSYERNIENLTRQLKDLQSEQKKVGTGTKEYKELQKAINKVNEALEEEKKIADDVAKSLGKQTSTFTKIADGFKASIGAIPGLIAANLATDAIKDFAGESIKAADEFRKLREEVLLLGGDAETADELTARIKAVADTFDQDYKEVLIAANALSNQLGITTEEALTKIEDGFLSGADVQGEFLSILKEYPGQFREAGFSAQEFINIATATQKEGIFSDKGVDLVKEFGLRIREQAQGTSDALTAAFGEEFTEDLFKGVRDGSISSAEALVKVSDQLNVVGTTAQEQQTIIADVFGGPGEEVGIEYIERLGDIIRTQGEAKDSLEGLNEEQRAVIEQRRQLLESNQNLQMAFAELSEAIGGQNTEFQILRNEIQAALIKGLADLISILQTIIKFLWDFKEVVTVVTVALVAYRAALAAQKGVGFAATVIENIKAVGTFIKTLRAQILALRAARSAQIALNLAQLANPIGLLIAGIAALIAIIGILINKYVGWEKALNKINEGWLKQKANIKIFIDTLKNFKKAFEVIFDNLKKLVSDLWDNFKRTFTNIKNFIKGIFTLDSKLIKQSLDNILGIFKNTWNKIKNFITGSGDEINKAYKNSIKDARKTANQLFDDIKQQQDNLKKELERKKLILNFDIKPFQDNVKEAEGDLQKLRKVLKELQNEQKKFKPEDKPYKELQTEISKVVAEIDKISKTSKDAADKAAKAFKKLQEQAEALRFEARVFLAGEEETIKGLRLLRDKALEQLKLKAGFSLLTPEEQEALIDKTIKPFLEKERKLVDEVRTESIERRRVSFETQIKNFEEFQKEQTRIFTDARKKIEESEELTTIDKEEQILEINKKEAEEKKRLTEELIEIKREQLDFENAAAIENIQKQIDVELDLREQGLINEEQLNDRLRKLNQKRLEITEANELKLRSFENKRVEAVTKANEQIEKATEALTEFQIEQQRKLLQEDIEKTKALGDEVIKRIQAIEAYYAFELELAKGNAEAIKKLEKEKADAIAAASEEAKETGNFKQRFAAIKSLFEREKELAEDNVQKQKELTGQFISDVSGLVAEELGELKKTFDDISSIASDVSNIITDNIINNINREIEARDAAVERRNEQITELEAAADNATNRQAERLNEEVRNLQKKNKKEIEEKQKLERKKEEAARQAALVEKGIALGKAVISTAQSVAAALAGPPPVPFSIPNAVLAGALGAAEIATIIAQQFASGGVFEGSKGRGGVMFGARHRDGGIIVNGGAAELEDREIILTRGVFEDPKKRAIASALNQSAGGVAFAKGGVFGQKFQSGGVFLPTSENIESITNKALIDGLAGALANLPSPVVSVQEINTVQTNVAVIEDNVI